MEEFKLTPPRLTKPRKKDAGRIAAKHHAAHRIRLELRAAEHHEITVARRNAIIRDELIALLGRERIEEMERLGVWRTIFNVFSASVMGLIRDANKKRVAYVDKGRDMVVYVPLSRNTDSLAAIAKARGNNGKAERDTERRIHKRIRYVKAGGADNEQEELDGLETGTDGR